MAATPSGAPIEKRRVDVRGSKGWDVASTAARAGQHIRNGSRELVRAIGRYEHRVASFRNNGSLKSRRSLPSPWLTADGVRFSFSAAARHMTLGEHGFEQNEQVQIRSREIDLIQHVPEIISLHSVASGRDSAPHTPGEHARFFHAASYSPRAQDSLRLQRYARIRIPREKRHVSPPVRKKPTIC